jgi:hypothetical protein
MILGYSALEVGTNFWDGQANSIYFKGRNETRMVIEEVCGWHFGVLLSCEKHHQSLRRSCAYLWYVEHQYWIAHYLLIRTSVPVVR